MTLKYKKRGKKSMKKILSILLVLCLMFAVVACAVETPAPVQPATPNEPSTPAETPVTPADPTTPADDTQVDPAPLPGDGEPFPGVIAVITNTVDQNEEEFRSAQALQLKYGTDKIVHRTWPVLFAQEGEMMISTMQEIANIPDLKAVIINQAVVNTNAAVDKLREIHGDDVFVVYANGAENPDDIAARADLLFDFEPTLIGEAYVMQAKSMGAEKIAFYSFPRHLSMPLIALRRDVMKSTAEREGIEFLDIAALDPMGDGGMAASQLFVMEDVPRQVDVLGKDVSFYSSNCGMQLPLIQQVVANGAIYSMPCDPSPYHAFPAALGITSHIPTGTFDADGKEIMRFRDMGEVIEATKNHIAAKGMTGRVSNWPVPGAQMWTALGAEYAIKWINGEVSRDFGAIDLDVIRELADEYIYENTGAKVDVTLQTYDIGGTRFSHYILGMVGFITY